MLSNAYFLAKFRFDTAENEPAKILQNFAKFANCATSRNRTASALQAFAASWAARVASFPQRHARICPSTGAGIPSNCAPSVTTAYHRACSTMSSFATRFANTSRNQNFFATIESLTRRETYAGKI